MEACIAFDELAASYNFRAMAERLRAIVPSLMLPAHDAFAVAYNCAALKSAWYRKLEAFNLITLSPSLEMVYVQYRMTIFSDYEFAEALEDIEQLAGFNVYALLRYDGILTPDEISAVSEQYASESVQKTIQKELAVWGMDNYTEIAIKVTADADTLFTDGAQYIIPLRLFEINGRWLVDPGSLVLGNLLGKRVNDLLVALP